MANGLAPYYLLQSSFTGGEISPEVANRVDLDKYNSAVLKATNCHIKPYGPIYKRPGLKYIARAKYADKKSILVPFNGSNSQDYLLEIGEKYIRVFKDGVYLNVELTTPFTVNTLNKLRFTQSADTMFIVSGDFPVKKLVRYSDTSWVFSDFALDEPYFDISIIESAEDTTIAPSGTSGSVTLTASADLFTSDMVGTMVLLKQEVPTQEVSTSSGTTGSIYCGDGWKVITHGTWTGTVEVQKSTDNTNWQTYRKYTGKNDFIPTESGSATVIIE